MPANAYSIFTDRLLIRCYQPSDAPLVKSAIDNSLDHLLPWMPWAKHEPETVEAKAERLRKFRGEFDLDIDYTFGIFSKDESLLIGSTGLHKRLDRNAREIGYWIHANNLRKGYALEAASALVKTGFEIEGLDRIEIHCASNNLRSQAIPKKLGFILEATLKDRAIDTEGNPRDVMIWTLFRDGYKLSEAKSIRTQAFDALGREITV